MASDGRGAGGRRADIDDHLAGGVPGGPGPECAGEVFQLQHLGHDRADLSGVEEPGEFSQLLAAGFDGEVQAADIFSRPMVTGGRLGDGDQDSAWPQH